MSVRVFGAIFVGVILCGCSGADWDYATTYAGLGQTDQAAAIATPPAQTQAAPSSIAQASSSEDWCRRLAKVDKEDAASDGFDQPTQQRIADASYRQCIEIPGSAMR